MNAERGNLSIHSENIFPIIKKWLYSDHDIFMRELISNGCDAITKLKKLEMVGEAVIPEGTDFKVTVSVNQEEKTIKIIDNGVGKTEFLSLFVHPYDELVYGTGESVRNRVGGVAVGAHQQKIQPYL